MRCPEDVQMQRSGMAIIWAAASTNDLDLGDEWVYFAIGLQVLD